MLPAMFRRWTYGVVLFGTLAIAAGVAQGQTPDRTFKGRLSVVPIDLAMAKSVAGSGSITGTLKGRTLVVTGNFEGLRSSATVAHLHRGANRGLRGPSIGDLTVASAAEGEISGSIDLTAAQVEDLQNGRLYVQLHSESAPDGNLWGWLLPK